MIRVYIADSLPEERSALRLLLLDLKMEVVGESSNWLTTFDLAPLSKLNMLLVDWNMLPPDSNAAFAALRAACPSPVVIVLISHLDVRQQAALSSGADAFISKSEPPDRVANRLQTAAESIIH
jgi:DNA-binding NarL/FixJ family response regulator